MTKRSWLVPCCLLVFACGSCIVVIINPMSSARRPVEIIRAEIVKATPIGSTEEEVDRYAKSHFRQDNFYHWTDEKDGRRALTCQYGSYVESFPVATCIRVTWYFSLDRVLADVIVDKWGDGF